MGMSKKEYEAQVKQLRQQGASRAAAERATREQALRRQRADEQLAKAKHDREQDQRRKR